MSVVLFGVGRAHLRRWRLLFLGTTHSTSRSQPMKNANDSAKPQPPAEDQLDERYLDGDESAVDGELYDPLAAASQRDIRRALPGVIRRAHMDAERR